MQRRRQKRLYPVAVSDCGLHPALSMSLKSTYKINANDQLGLASPSSLDLDGATARSAVALRTLRSIAVALSISSLSLWGIARRALGRLGVALRSVSLSSACVDGWRRHGARWPTVLSWSSELATRRGVGVAGRTAERVVWVHGALRRAVGRQ